MPRQERETSSEGIGEATRAAVAGCFGAAFDFFSLQAVIPVGPGSRTVDAGEIPRSWPEFEARARIPWSDVWRRLPLRSEGDGGLVEGSEPVGDSASQRL